MTKWSNKWYMVNDPYGEADRSTVGRKEMVNDFMDNDQLKLENQLCFRLYSAARLMMGAYHPYLDPLGITYPQYL
ncbi:MAG: hypothetical protein IJS57_00265, partial [Paludibacteraceae bacterium]|nr:hypothetical protein [Paludibacteraceae bacterium]